VNKLSTVKSKKARPHRRRRQAGRQCALLIIGLEALPCVLSLVSSSFLFQFAAAVVCAPESELLFFFLSCFSFFSSKKNLHGGRRRHQSNKKQQQEEGLMREQQ
jgi:hypothetical protein